MRHDFCTATNNPIIFNPDICVGCNICVESCRRDIFSPNLVSGKSPTISYPEECWYCGACVSDCPNTGAIKMRQPLNQRIGFIRKTTGEFFRTQ